METEMIAIIFLIVSCLIIFFSAFAAERRSNSLKATRVYEMLNRYEGKLRINSKLELQLGEIDYLKGFMGVPNVYELKFVLNGEVTEKQDHGLIFNDDQIRLNKIWKKDVKRALRFYNSQMEKTDKETAAYKKEENQKQLNDLKRKYNQN